MKNKKQIIIPMTIAFLSIGGISLGTILERNISFSKTSNNIVEKNYNENTKDIEELNPKQSIDSTNDYIETTDDTSENNSNENINSVESTSQTNKNSNQKQQSNNSNNNKLDEQTTIPESNTIKEETKPENIKVESIFFPKDKYFAEYNSSITSFTSQHKIIDPITPVFSPSNATNQDYTLSSSNEDVAHITENNKIELKKNGTAIITAKSVDGNYESSYTLRVVTKATVNIFIREEIDPTQYKMPKVLGIVLKITNWESVKSYTSPRFSVDIKIYKDNELIETASLKEQRPYTERFVYVLKDYESATYKVEYTVHDSGNGYTFTDEATATINKTS